VSFLQNQRRHSEKGCSGGRHGLFGSNLLRHQIAQGRCGPAAAEPQVIALGLALDHGYLRMLFFFLFATDFFRPPVDCFFFAMAPSPSLLDISVLKWFISARSDRKHSEKGYAGVLPKIIVGA
jgi:hypothetical protein